MAHRQDVLQSALRIPSFWVIRIKAVPAAADNRGRQHRAICASNSEGDQRGELQNDSQSRINAKRLASKRLYFNQPKFAENEYDLFSGKGMVQIYTDVPHWFTVFPVTSCEENQGLSGISIRPERGALPDYAIFGMLKAVPLKRRSQATH